MTDREIQSLYSKYLSISHVAALRAIFAAGYANHAGISTAVGDPSSSAALSSAITAASAVVLPKNNDGDTNKG